MCTPDTSLSDTESNEDFLSTDHVSSLSYNMSHSHFYLLKCVMYPFSWKIQANSLMHKFTDAVKIKGAVMKEKISNYIKNEYGPDTER